MLVGIDTGGTFTDAVLFDPDRGPGGTVVATAKAPTRADLTIGIAEVLDQVLAPVADHPGVVRAVSLSTTLATNALVEGRGAPVALVLIGFDDIDLDRYQLRSTVGSDPVITIDGGHDSLGVERQPLDLDTLVAAATEVVDRVEAFAVTARFAVRNPDHELAAADALAALGRPVACGHQLTARLDGPRRALTCLLNARLINLIDDLCAATEAMLARRSITAPLLVVRGDGSLVAAGPARRRPIETILSGPAASLIGAARLAGADDVIVADIGGTTTDIGRLRNRRPAVAADGAVVGGHRTMVEAVAVFTHGLGGDSEVDLDLSDRRPRLILGPRRLVPLARAGDRAEAETIRSTLEQLTPPLRLHHTRFLRATGRGGRPVGERSARLLERLSVERWTPQADVVDGAADQARLRSLVDAGVVESAGFTPTDAALVLDLHHLGDRVVAKAAAAVMAALGDSMGDPVRPDGASFSRWVVDTVSRRSAELVLAAALADDGLDPDLATGPLATRSLDDRLLQPLLTDHQSQAGSGRSVAVRLGLEVPLVGLGASSSTYYPAVGQLLNTAVSVPDHAPVANAVGAAVATVRVARTATITQPSKGRFRVHLPGLDDRGDLQPAIDDALRYLTARVEAETIEAGAATVTIDHDVKVADATIEGRRFFVEATVTVIGAGPPILPARSAS